MNPSQAYRRTAFATRNVRCPDRNHAIDLALAVMCALQVPGQCVSHDAIAEVTGMAHSGPWEIEHRALKKLRRRIRL